MILKTLIILILVYLIGSISGSIIVSKNFFKEDIRLKGSGNAGTTNTFRAYGLKYAALALSIDLLKGTFALYLANFLGDKFQAYENIRYIAGVVVVVGHIWPIYYGFKGGKGVATSFGANLFLDPFMTLIQFIEFFVFNYIFRIMSITTLIMTYSAIIYQIIRNDNIYFLAMVIINAILITYSHRKNIKRLIDGKENKIERLGKK